MIKTMTILAATLLLATPVLAQSTSPNTTPSGKKYLQTSGGQALYVYDGDRTAGGSPGAPTCSGQCATYWPPFTANADAKAAGDWGVVAREDGSKQWVYKGRPLYTFVRDQNAGKVEGDGFNGNKWHLAEP